MKSLVSELQVRSLDSGTTVSELLRMAKIVAVKLDLEEFRRWIASELDGYDGIEVPPYRTIKGELKAWNPYHGYVSAVFPDDNLAKDCTTRKVHQKISEIELLAGRSEGKLFIPLSDQQQLLLRQFFKTDMELKLIFSPIALAGILDSVRNVILDWSLKLEQNGILGEGITFSNEDKAKAHSPGVTYKIGKIENFTGTMGVVKDHAVVNATTNVGIDADGLTSLIKQLEQSKGQFGLTSGKQAELEETLSELGTALDSAKPKASNVGALLGTARAIIQSAGSSLLVQGALFEIDKFKHLIQM
jgi:hypothetical protein